MIRFLARLQPWTLLLIRLALGFTMVYYSWSKVYPAGGFHSGHLLAAVERNNDYIAHLGLPRWLGYVSTISEFIGGVSLLVGLLTRFWAFMIAIDLLVALVVVNIHHGYVGSEYTIALITMSLLLVTAGSGELSLDRRCGFA